MQKENPDKQSYQLLPIFTFFLLTVVLASCDFRSLKDPIVLTDVEDEFLIDIWEEITPEGRTFQLLIQTIKDQPCSNSTIDFSVSRTSTVFDISLQDITAPDDCVPGEAPALARISLGDLSPGFYPLNIDLRDAIVNEGSVRVRSDAYQLSMDSEYGIRPLRSELRRVAPEHFWGYISYPPQLKNAVDSLQNELGDFGSYELPQDGYYGYFTVANGNLAIKDQPQHQSLATWIMPIADTDKDELANLIHTFRDTYAAEGLRIDFYDGKGGRY